MGGAARWRDLRSIRVESVGHQHALEQSERPEGPWITTYTQVSEFRDLEHDRLRRHQQQRGLWSSEWSGYDVVADTRSAAMQARGRTGPAQRSQQRDAMDRLALSPERILLTALAASDLAAEGDTVLQGVRHEVVGFTHDGRRVRLFVNASSHLPAGYAAPAPMGSSFQQMWGDTPVTTLWSLWSLEPGGRMYPRQRDVFEFGFPLESELVAGVEFDVPAPADSFDIAPETRAAFDAAADRGLLTAYHPGVSFGPPLPEPTELADGVITIPGIYAATLVAQSDGVVILEAPMTSAWSADVIAEAARRFPGRPVKAVVSTSDAWLHIGGLREYAARGIPIHALDLNVPIVRRLLTAPRERDPDALARAGASAATPAVRAVAGPTTIGTGPNRLEIYPVRGEGGERMMVAYLPERRILFASDLLQVQPDGTAFWPEYLTEIRDVIERNHLRPDTVFAMHTPPMKWSDAMALLAATERSP